MKNIFGLSSLLLVSAVLTACATTPKNTLAIQKENNQYEVTGVGKTNIISKNNAVSAANSTCGNRAAPVVVDEKTGYNGVFKGVVDEQTGQMVQAAAGVLGAITGSRTSISRDDDYQTVLTFYCRAN